MDADVSKAGWDIFVFGIPLIAFLVFGFFRLDQSYTSRKQGSTFPRPAGSELREHVRSMRSDPDGRPWDEN